VPTVYSSSTCIGVQLCNAQIIMEDLETHLCIYIYCDWLVLETGTEHGDADLNGRLDILLHPWDADSVDMIGS
jgi:hypothetical protein